MPDSVLEPRGETIRDIQCSTKLRYSREAAKDKKQGLFTEKASVFGTQEAVAAII